MNHIKDYMASAIRQEILELQRLLCSIEDNSHLGKEQKYDLGLSTIQLVEWRLKNLRRQMKSHYSQN